MFQTLKDFFEALIQPDAEPSPQKTANAIQLAAAVLLVEVVRFDAAADEAERATIVSALRTRFKLSDAEINPLIALAQTTSRTAYDYQHFTGQLNDRCTHDEKVQWVEAMWQVAYADEHIDANENHTISKVAGLLNVTHGEYISAKMRAKEAAHAT